MRPGSRLVCCVWALLTLTLAARAQPGARAFEGPQVSTSSSLHVSTPSSPQASKPSGPPVSSDFLGSKACARCHDVESSQWNNSLHVKMTKPVAEALIVGDFSDRARLADHGRAYVFGTKAGKPFMTITFGDRAPETFTVDYTLGAKRYQGYLSTLPDGRIYVLPAFWHIATRRWVDWKEITPIPEGAHNMRQIWNVNCFNCHGTNIVQGYDIEATRYESTWTEMGIGCEACHGPGREHVVVMDGWEKDPASKPAYDNSSKNPRLSDILKILSTKSAPPRRVYDTCAYCHGNKTNVFVGFRGGDRYADFAMPFLLSDPIPPNDLQGEFWPDGRPNRFNRPQALSLSGCFKAGAVTCTNCHVAHGSRNDFSLKVNIHQGRNGDSLCTQCHNEPKTVGHAVEAAVQTVTAKPSFTGAGLARHTFHKPESEGSRCINCHMSDVNWRLLIRRRDHTFQPPVPETTERYGIPNACTTCHDDRTPEWAARQMDAWWGDGGRRAKSVTVADTMYRAGSGDVTVLPELTRLALDRSEGFILRASAADYVARLISSGGVGVPRDPSAQSQTSFGAQSDAAVRGAAAPTRTTQAVPAITPTQINALIGAAADPEPVVRAAALRALGATAQRDRVLGPVLARLVDSSRVVRARAAEVLASLGVVELPGKAGDALLRAQGDYVASLQMFPDVASNHATLGWFQAERGQVDAARTALDSALKVEPKYAFPWVVKGVISAREGRFVEAVGFWKKAREIEPAYPNLDQLIAEAEKRK